MNKFENREAAFASQNYDPAKVEITGVPERHIAALKAVANLFVAHDAVNPDFVPDYTDYDQDKFTALHHDYSPSGDGFSFLDYGRWNTSSDVGSRLESESEEACDHLAEICEEDYKAFKVYDRSAK